jgi:hypothetical protein
MFEEIKNIRGKFLIDELKILNFLISIVCTKVLSMWKKVSRATAESVIADHSIASYQSLDLELKRVKVGFMMKMERACG